MTIDDDTLMAYADGELDEPARREVERAMREDPSLARRIEAHRALRHRVNAAFDGVRTEPMPERLRRLLEQGDGPAAGSHAGADIDAGGVIDLARARAARTQARARRATRWSLPQWAAMAATLVLGIAIGRFALQGAGDTLVERGGATVARGVLARALTQQLARTQAEDAPVQIRTSFVDHSGRYCRAFEMSGQAGVACREGDEWALQALFTPPDVGGRPAAGATANASGSAGSPMRQAETPLPPALLTAIDASIEGDPLSAADEAKAQARGWRR